MPDGFLDLLLAGADRTALDEVLAAAEAAGPDAAELDRVRRDHAAAVALHAQIARQRSREAEAAALYETANDLTAIRDLDQILAAIVRRARQLLRADMTYLSLNDETEGASYMRVTDGALTPEFATLRLPLGTGLLGLVAQSGAPYFTADYQHDQRFVHRGYIDAAVDGEHIRAILGVPLTVDGVVIGALLAVHRTVRSFPPEEVALLTSFAAHAAVALENARLFEAAAAANRELSERSEATEAAAHAHDLMTDVLVAGGGLLEVGRVLAQALDGELRVYDEEGRPLVGGGADAVDLVEPEAVAAARASGRSVPLADGRWLAAAAAGEDHLGTLVLRARRPVGDVERRTLERGALLTALVLLFQRTEADAEERVRGELLSDLLGDRAGGHHDAERLLERVRLLGARLDDAPVLLVADVEGAERHRAVRAAAGLAREWAGLAGELDGRVVLVASDHEPLAAAADLQARLGRLASSVTVGAASADDGLLGLRAAWRDASRTVTSLLTLGRRGAVSDAAGLGLTRLLLGDNGPRALTDFVSGTVGPVLEHDRDHGTALVETLAAYFAVGGSPTRAAGTLHVHANTVGQRLQRVDRLLGEGWRSGEPALEVQLAIRLHTLDGGSGTH